MTPVKSRAFTEDMSTANIFTSSEVVGFDYLTAVSNMDLVRQRTEDGFGIEEAFGLQRDSEFRELFDYHLRKMLQTGLIDEKKRKWVR